MKAALPPLVHAPRLRIGDRWCQGASTYEARCMASGEPLASIPQGNLELLQAATKEAHSAFNAHRLDPAHERASRLTRLAHAIEERRAAFAALIVAEAGKPVTLAHAEVDRAISTFTLAAEEGRHQQGGLLDLDAQPAGEGHFGVVRRFPLGVIAAITPFNFPLNLAAHKIAPALAVGNGVVMKPSPRTPLTALLLAEAAEAAGVPPGLFNVVTAPNEAVAQWIADPLVRMVSFTGSASVGWRLQALSAGKRYALELGGNAAVIVHEDASLEDAIPAIARGAFAYAGQSCISVQRVLVHASRLAEVRERLVDFTRTRIRSGNPRDPSVILGPMIDRASVDRTLARLAEAAQAGAQTLTGGRAEGLFLEPTIVESAPDHCALMREEVFAPVVALTGYTDISEAFKRANDSAYGLQASLFTGDLGLAWKAFEELEVGGVLINEVPTWRVENMPYGGVKASGLGREGVRSAMEEMTEPRSWIWRTARRS